MDQGLVVILFTIIRLCIRKDYLLSNIYLVASTCMYSEDQAQFVKDQWIISISLHKS